MLSKKVFNTETSHKKSLHETIVGLLFNELYSAIPKILITLVYQLTFYNTKYNIT